jgi:rubrerythrin
MHFLQLYELLRGRHDVLKGVSPSLQHWLNFLAFGGLKEEREMSRLVENDPLVMAAVAELQHFTADPDMQELERRRKLWRLEYYSGTAAAKEEGVADAAQTFELIAKVEKQHGDRFKRLLDRVSNGNVFKRDEKIQWRCLDCGTIHEGTSAPGACPCCKKPQSWFEPVGEAF